MCFVKTSVFSAAKGPVLSVWLTADPTGSFMMRYVPWNVV